MLFPSPGAENTDETISIALEAAERLDIRRMVVASHTGETAIRLAGCGRQVTCVTHVGGSKNKGENAISPEMARRLEDAGIRTLTTTHIFDGVERAISRMTGGMYPGEIMANTLRLFGQGVKVCVEIAVMATDGGCIPRGEEVIAIAGTSRGADTALVLRPDHAAGIFGVHVVDILCKPR